MNASIRSIETHDLGHPEISAELDRLEHGLVAVAEYRDLSPAVNRHERGGREAHHVRVDEELEPPLVCRRGPEHYNKEALDDPSARRNGHAHNRRRKASG